MNQSECRALVQSLAQRQGLSEFDERAAKARERKARKYAGELLPGTLTKTVARRVSGEYRDVQGDCVVEPESAKAFNAHYDRVEAERAAVLVLIASGKREPSLEDVILDALRSL